MEYLKERLNLDGNNGVKRSFYNDYAFNKDIVEELKKRGIDISFFDDDTTTIKRLNTKFCHPLDSNEFEIEYNKLVIELADELQNLNITKFDTPVISTGIIVDPVTYQLVTSFGTRY